MRAWLAAGAVALLGLPAPPQPDAVLPHDPGKLALELVRTDRDLHTAIDGWVATGTSRGEPPKEVTLLGLYEQRAYRLLARDAWLERATLRVLPSGLAAAARDTVTARRDLFRLTPPTRYRLHVGKALPAGILLADYREAQRRFGVDWRVLASINFVESAFGRVRSSSTAGAQGPMQFLPATWRRYGLGGDIRDPHDAILGAANYLHANGAPGTCAGRSTTTTRRASTSTRSCATPAGCGSTRARTTRSTAGRSSSGRRRATCGSRARAAAEGRSSQRARRHRRRVDDRPSRPADECERPAQG